MLPLWQFLFALLGAHTQKQNYAILPIEIIRFMCTWYAFAKYNQAYIFRIPKSAGSSLVSQEEDVSPRLCQEAALPQLSNP